MMKLDTIHFMSHLLMSNFSDWVELMVRSRVVAGGAVLTDRHVAGETEEFKCLMLVLKTFHRSLKSFAIKFRDINHSVTLN